MQNFFYGTPSVERLEDLYFAIPLPSNHPGISCAIMVLFEPVRERFLPRWERMG
jgi:hypothetical protein